MKKGLILIAFLAIGLLGASCASTNPAVAEQRKAEDIALFNQAKQALDEGSFVLETDRIEFRGGGTANVASNTNFISAKDNYAIVQLAFNNGRPGLNNLGGITLEGRISNIKTTTDRKGNITYRMNVQGAYLSSVIEVVLYYGGDQAMATVYPNFSSNRITVRGTLYPSELSNVFKGRSL